MKMRAFVFLAAFAVVAHAATREAVRQSDLVLLVTHALNPGRQPDLADWIADALGATAGFLAVMRYHRRRHVSRHPTLR